MKVDNSEIFDVIGDLLYAIAKDQGVKRLEEGELKLLISDRWLPRTYTGNESIISDETHFIITAMDELEASNASPEEAFSRFTRFYSLHPHVFSKEVKSTIIETAEDIVRIFKADNPGDNDHLNLLKELWGINRVEKA